MPRRLITKHWTAQEYVRLRSLWALPLSSRAVALRMDRTRKTILKKARELGFCLRKARYRDSLTRLDNEKIIISF